MAGKTKEFSIMNIKDTFDEVSENLVAAITKSNPNLDVDAFDMELRQLVMRYGRGGFTTSLAEVAASLTEVKPVYVEAGDILVLAHQAFKSGDIEESIKLFLSAQDCDGMDDLIEAIYTNNAKSATGVIAEDDNDEEDTGDSENSEDDEESDTSEEGDTTSEGDGDEEEDGDIFPIIDDNTLDGPDDTLDDVDEENVDELVSNLASLDGLGEETNTSLPKAPDLSKDAPTPKEPDEEEDENDNSSDNDSLPMGGVSSSKVETLKIAAANKLSLTGTDEDRGKATKILRRA